VHSTLTSKVRITWYGHSYFLIEIGGNKIVLDPHDGGSLNLPEFRVESDYVLVTHNHYDHNAIEMVKSPNIIKWRKGLFRLEDDITVRGILSYHDKASGEIRGTNIIYVINYKNLSIAHFGDLGHLPDEDLLSMIGKVDIAMIPVGGVYTIDAEEAWELTTMLNPRIVIPMHFWIPYSTLPLDPLEKFLNIAKARRLRLEERTLEIQENELPEKTTIAVMPPPTIKDAIK
jgi:L-ascorbate metabolism protein UlaG (beta-lactamase superfamily)